MKTQVINVNLAPCTKRCHEAFKDGGHYDNCHARPVLIPCPIQRSVGMEVRLGECTCPPPGPCGPFVVEGHRTDCCSRPIRVACDIGGETWAASEVTDVETISGPSGNPNAVIAACLELWALLKTVLLGAQQDAITQVPWATWEALHQQRDAVFAALADSACAHIKRNAASNAATKAAGLERLYPEEVTEDSREAEILKKYVARLIEQLGVL